MSNMTATNHIWWVGNDHLAFASFIELPSLLDELETCEAAMLSLDIWNFEAMQEEIKSLHVATPLWTKCEDETHIPKSGDLESSGLPKTQSLIAGVKTPCIGVFYISMERSWSLDVQNGLAWAIWTSATQVTGKRRVESQTGNLTPDHWKSGIDLFLTSTRGVRYGIEKLPRRATTLV